MSIDSVLAQSTVADLDDARAWYATLLGREPDTAPMPGLLEWHLGHGCGLQVYAEPARAGRSSVVLGESDLDGAAARLAAAGLRHEGVEQATSSRILRLLDPDGNRVVLVGS